MCIAIPGKIISIDGIYAIVESMGLEQKVNIQLIESPNVGIYVLVHAGFAIECICEAYYTYLEERYHEYLANAEND